MKATIDFEETLYRRLKIEAARRGGTIRELVQEGVRYVLDLPPPTDPDKPKPDRAWFASLREYAANAGGAHDLPAIRRSIAKKRPRRA
jgi:hypothetical protein